MCGLIYYFRAVFFVLSERGNNSIEKEYHISCNRAEDGSASENSDLYRDKGRVNLL